MFSLRYYSGDQDRLFSEAHIVSPNRTNLRPTPSKRVSNTSQAKIVIAPSYFHDFQICQEISVCKSYVRDISAVDCS